MLPRKHHPCALTEREVKLLAYDLCVQTPPLWCIRHLARRLGAQVNFVFIKRRRKFKGRRQRIKSSTSNVWTTERACAAERKMKWIARGWVSPSNSWALWKDRPIKSRELIDKEDDAEGRLDWYGFQNKRLPPKPKPNPRKEKAKEEARDFVEAGGEFSDDETITFLNYLEDETAGEAALYAGVGEEAMKKRRQRLGKYLSSKKKEAENYERYSAALNRLYKSEINPHGKIESNPHGWHILVETPHCEPQLFRLDVEKGATEEQIEAAIDAAAYEEQLRLAEASLRKAGKWRSSLTADKTSLNPEGKDFCRPIWAKVKQAFEDGLVTYLTYHEEGEQCSMPGCSDDPAMLLIPKELEDVR